MYVERLPSGQFGVYRTDGRRIAVFHTKELALRHIRMLQRKRRKK